MEENWADPIGKKDVSASVKRYGEVMASIYFSIEMEKSVIIQINSLIELQNDGHNFID